MATNNNYRRPLAQEYGTIEYARTNNLQFVKTQATPQTQAAMIAEMTASTSQSPDMQMYPMQGLSYGGSSPGVEVIVDAQSTAAFALNRAASPGATEQNTNEVLDRKFYTMMLEIDKRYQAGDSKL